MVTVADTSDIACRSANDSATSETPFTVSRHVSASRVGGEEWLRR